MTGSKNDIHAKAVSNWLEVRGGNLSPDQKVKLLKKAILAIEVRAAVTLSSLTLMVVLDRILRQSKEKLPLLAGVTIEDRVLNFQALATAGREAEAADALAYLLAELLRVLGRLTAEILTTSLHKELMDTNVNDSGES
jgi:hypothetical protein